MKPTLRGPLSRILSGAVLVAAALVVASPPALTTPAAAAPPGVVNGPMNLLFGLYGTNATCSEWSGGDSLSSLRLTGHDLSDHGVAYFFADTYLNAPAARQNGGFGKSFINNSIVVRERDGDMRTMTGGNTCRETDTSVDFYARYAKPVVSKPDGTSWYWNGDVTAVRPGFDGLPAELYVAYYYRAVSDNGLFRVVDWKPVQFTLDDLGSGFVAHPQPVSQTWAQLRCTGASETVIWGANVSAEPATSAREGDPLIYGWGLNSHQPYVARIPSGAEYHDPGSWLYNTGGNGWSRDCRLARSAPIRVESKFSVLFLNGNYWLIQHEPVAGSGRILAYPATTANGFTGSRAVVLYNAPEAGHTAPTYHLIYDAAVQIVPPGLYSNGITISYNVNTTAVSIGCGSRNNYDGSIYRPRFIDVPPSAFVASSAVAIAPPPATATAGLAVPDSPVAGHGVRGGAARLPTPPPGLAGKAGVRPQPAPAMPAGPSSGGSVPAGSAPGAASLGAAVPGAARAAFDSGWYDSWSSAYEGNHRCPPLQSRTASPLSVALQPDASVKIAWNAVGLDVWYWLMERDVTANLLPKIPELWHTDAAAEVAPVISAANHGHVFEWWVVGWASGFGGPGEIDAPESNKAQVKVVMQAPRAPAGVSAAPLGTHIRVQWSGVTYPSPSVYYYINYYSASSPLQRSFPYDPDKRSGEVADLVSGRRYTFYVTAENLGGVSPKSTEVAVTAP